MLVLEYHRQHRCRSRRQCAGAAADPHRWNPDLVAGREALIGRRPPAVDADLPAANHLVDVALGHALAEPDQKIVQSLTRGFGAHGDVSDTSRTGGRRGGVRRVTGSSVIVGAAARMPGASRIRIVRWAA